VLDQHRLAGARGAEHHRDHVVGEAEVAPVQDAGPAELLDEVDDLDRVLAAVVALLTRMPLVWIRVVSVDTGDDVVARGEVLLAEALGLERIGGLLDCLRLGGLQRSGFLGRGGSPLSCRRGAAGGATRTASRWSGWDEARFDVERELDPLLEAVVVFLLVGLFFSANCHSSLHG